MVMSEQNGDLIKSFNRKYTRYWQHVFPISGSPFYPL